MKTIINITATVLALLLLASCGNLPEQPPSDVPESTTAGEAPVTAAAEDTDKTVRLPVCINDSLDPFIAKTKQNTELAMLMYEPLIRLDKKFMPTPALAADFVCADSQCVVRIREGAVFSDGSPVTPEDVIYSLQKARESERLGGGLGNMAAVFPGEGNSVVITLAEPDIYFINLLDIPVIKSEIDEQTDNDRFVPPTGSGRYRFTNKDGALKLRVNSKYNGGKKPGIKVIELIDTPDDQSLMYRVTTDALSAYYTDLSDGELPRINGSLSYVNLNSLVFIGVNSTRAPLDSSYVRRALSLGIGRAEIAEDAYFDSAAPALSPFNPCWKLLDYKFPSSDQPDADAAMEDLSAEGFADPTPDGFLQRDGEALELTMLVNAENSLRKTAAGKIQKALGGAGIKIILEEIKFSEYNERIAMGDFDLYLGEVMISNNMDITPLLDPSSPAAKGVSGENLTLEKFRQLKSGQGKLSAVLDEFYNEYPFIPLVYRRGAFFLRPQLKKKPVATVSDIYYNIEKWKIK